MQYQIFVQQRDNNGYRASVLGIPACVAEGATEAEAIANANAALSQWLAQGKLVSIEIVNGVPVKADDPWRKLYGKYADDPTWDEYQANIAEYRRELDAAEAARLAEEEAQAAAAQ